MLPGTVTCSATSPDRPADSASAITGTSPARPTRLASSNSAEKSWDTRTTSAPVAQRYGTLDKSHYRWPQEHLAVTTHPPDRRIQAQPRTEKEVHRMAKIAALSGFPEWLPAERLVEQHVIDVFREVAELHGFSGIESRAAEPLDQLLRKGEIDKEVYVLRRLHAEEEGADPAREDRARTLGLHFDLTVPLARYVLEHQNDLAFP